MSDKQAGRKYSLYFKSEELRSDLEAIAAFYEVSYTQIMTCALEHYLKSIPDDLEVAREQQQARRERKAAMQAEQEAGD